MSITLDEAIIHCENVSRNCDSQCGKDHQQLAEWLKELKRLKQVQKWWHIVYGDEEMNQILAEIEVDK